MLPEISRPLHVDQLRFPDQAQFQEGPGQLPEEQSPSLLPVRAVYQPPEHLQHDVQFLHAS